MMLAIAVLAAALAGCGMLPKAAPTPTTAPISVAPLGTPVRDGGLEFVVSDVGPPPLYWVGRHPQGVWVVATMTVRNVGDGPQEYYAGNQTLVDTSGRKYGADATSATLPNNAVVADLNPGFSARVQVMFDVPEGTPLNAVEVHASGASAGAREAA
jgi:hypothetical protein